MTMQGIDPGPAACVSCVSCSGKVDMMFTAKGFGKEDGEWQRPVDGCDVPETLCT
jgi:hypothetical protein